MAFDLMRAIVPSSTFTFGPTLIRTSLALAPFRLTVKLIKSVYQLRIEFDRLFAIGVTPI